MELPVSVLFPSNLAAEHETMLEFKAFAMLQPEGEHAYRNRLSYSVTRVDGRPDGDPSRVRMRPMFRGETERLYPDFTKFYPDGFKRLGNEASRGTGYAEGELRFEVSSPGKWVFAPAVFAFIDSDDRILAEVEIPAFAPAAGN